MLPGLSLVVQKCYYQAISGLPVLSDEDLVIIDACISKAHLGDLPSEIITDFYLLWTLPKAVNNNRLVSEKTVAKLNSILLGSDFNRVLDFPIGPLKTHGSAIDKYVFKAKELRLSHKRVAICIGARSYILNSGEFSSTEVKNIFQFIIDHSTRKWLKLDSLKLKEIPPGILELTGIEKLHLNRNPISQLPPDFFKLQGLKELKLENTRITELPRELERLTNLEFLSLSYSKLKKIPAEIGKLSGLKELWFTESLLEDLPDDIANLRELKSLGIKLTPLSKNTTRVAKLRELGCPL